MKEFKPIKEGKVREVYDNGDSLIITATDRISAFDVILKNKVTDKGAILTQMSKFWFDLTENTVPNHMISTDVKDMPEAAGKAIKRTEPFAALSFQKDYRNLRNCLNRSIHLPQRLILEITMRTYLMIRQ